MYHDLIWFWSSLLCCPWLVRAMTIPFPPPPLYRARSGFGSEHTWTFHQIKYRRVKNKGRVSVSHLRSAILHIWCLFFAQIISWPSLFIEGIKMSINRQPQFTEYNNCPLRLPELSSTHASHVISCCPQKHNSGGFASPLESWGN